MEQSGSVRLFRDSLLLGENRAEFEELHQALIAEVAPAGALGEDIVADLARLLWRKQNFATFSLAERARTHSFELRAANSMRNFRRPTIHL
jgi:hypothetical protein